MSNSLMHISPVDGRYAGKTKALQDYFSEYALIKYRVTVEIKYFIALSKVSHDALPDLSPEQIQELESWVESFTPAEAEKIKGIERTTNHDVKAVEYWIKEKFQKTDMVDWQEFIHFGLTSQDINNTAMPMMVKDGLEEVIIPGFERIIDILDQKSSEWEDVPMLARTHGQPASPTRLGKEIQVFSYRMKTQLNHLKNLKISGKFGGATGNFNAHQVTFPEVDWVQFGDDFLKNDLDIERQSRTTQIENYDDLAATFQTVGRCNTILIDLCRDIWQYISQDYFKQRIVAGEVGSSAMPHKVNPIDFENAEGNLGLANAIFHHLAEKLPISRLQRDLTDSTVTRNIGVPLAHTLIAVSSLEKGLGKITLHQAALNEDLANNWAVVAEALQNILRRERYPKPYEALKALTRTGDKITEETIANFIAELDVSDSIKDEMRVITPFNYTGVNDG
ncbi:adenylosuccinate lyase [Membranicola marinus]|uniref:Adenylosuccinate lyase n=1 Tax=Membranihabitans marinus TaxID=1227546 RepID=A0A953L6C3_9BACT|nr:adenylosuccinate lyase [Membranihabitans marinus]MBY5957507.1 adenylosuccinate lyase [Membranihabitans marinus]